MASLLTNLPKKPKDRFEVYRLFDGWSEEGKDGLDTGKTRIPLVKTFLLEHVSERNGQTPKPLMDIWDGLNTQPVRIDETFYSVEGMHDDPDTGQKRPVVTGYVEKFDDRFFAYYTVEGSKEARSRVRHWVTRSPELDHTWFSSPMLKGLWDGYIRYQGDHRFSKMVFRHESIFELPEDSAEVPADDGPDPDTVSDEAEEKQELERRRFRSEMGDCIGRLKNSLEGLRESYSPLHALFSVRIPSTGSRGGHDITQEGLLTNRADSFTDHRNHAKFLWRLYKAVVEQTENSAWGAAGVAGKMTPGWAGVPLIVNFHEPLSDTTFNNWISKAFRKRNVFQIWGEPHRLGRTKVHVYGADRHLWQPINLELTEKRLVAILPRGTCGNTFHRLVANLQHYVSPRIDAWIGAQPFDSFMSWKAISLPDHES